MDIKKCNACKLEKYVKIDFPKNGEKYRSICKSCHCNKQKERYNKNKEDVLEKRKDFYNVNKEKIIEQNKKYRQENKEKICLQKKMYYQKNRDIILEKVKEDEYKEKRNILLKERRKNDKSFAMINAYRARLNEVLHKQKKNTYIHYLNCKRNEFINWIEFQFDNNFKWETYGNEWVIDHVIPIKFFNLHNEIDKYMCFSWFNLRPCKTKENLQKSDKIVLDIVKIHQIKINNYKKINLWYQTHIEIYEWLREKLRDGKNPSILDNSQPNS